MADNFTPEQLDVLNSFFNRIQSGNQAMDPYVRATQDATIAQQRYKIAVDIANSGLKSFGSALISPTSGVEKFGGSILAAGDAVEDFTKLFGAAGGVLGKVIGGLGSLAKWATIIGVEGLKRQDALARSFENLSEISAVATGGLEGLRDSLNYIGLTSIEGEKLVQVLRPITKELFLFGGSVTSGTQKLLDIFKGFVGPDSFERALMNIGYTSETIRDGVASYISMQTKMGFAQTKSTADLQQGAYKYLTTLKELQELTGLSRDEAQKQLEQQMADARFRYHLSQLNETEANNLRAYMVMYQKIYGEDEAKGLKDRIVNFGRVVSDAGSRSFQASERSYELAMEAQQKGASVFMNSIQEVGKDIIARTKVLENPFRLMEDGANDVGLGFGRVNGAMEINNTKSQTFLKTQEEMNELEKNGTALMNDRITLEQQQRKIRLEADNILLETSELFTKGLAKATEKINDFVGALLEAGNKIAKAFGSQRDFTTRQSDATGGYRKGTGFGSDTGMYPDSQFMATNMLGNPVDQEELATRQQRAAALSTSAAGRKMEILNKLKFKKGATSGGEADPALLALAEKINEKFADLGGIEITAMDDMYHRIKRPNSAHVRGKAMDFTIPGGDKLAPEETRRIKEWLKSQGASKVLDEYNDDYNPKDSTGKHFHVEVAKMGGFFKGNNSGYPVMLHGNESVWPEGKLGNLLKDVQKLSIDQYKDEILNKMGADTATLNNTNVPNIGTEQLINMLSDKLDDVLDILEKSYNTQDELLNYSKV